MADAGQLKQAVGKAAAGWGPVTGVVHGAGVLADKLVADKTVEQFRAVFDTKVSGLRSLMELETDVPLRLLVVASSVAARYGNSGQSDYAMANEVMTTVAEVERIRRPGCTVKAIAWGPWDGGMVTPGLRAHFQEAGVPLLSIPAGARAFVDELANDEPSVQVVLAAAGGPELPSSLNVEQARADVRVSKGSHPHLADHAVRETVVVPIAYVLEWMARAAGAFWPLDGIAFRELKMMRGIRLTEYAQGATSLFTVRAGGGNADPLLELIDREGMVHYQCRPKLDAPFEVQPGAVSLDLDGNLGAPPSEGSVPYGGRALFHGPGFRALERIDALHDTGARGRVRGLPR